MDKSFVQARMMEYAKTSKRSMAEISKKMGHRGNYLSNALNGHFDPKLDELLFFCTLLGIEPADFFREEEVTLEQQQLIAKILSMTPSQVRAISQLADELLKQNKR